FVTDRFSTNVEELSFGNERLALIDPDGGDPKEVTTFTDAKNIDPQWSSDGKSLYFLSDHRGISNVYRAQVADGSLSQITNMRTGVSGITQLSPALASARDVDRVVFGSYENGSYSLYRIDSHETLAGRAPSGPIAGADPGVLPPQGRGTAEVESLRRKAD